MIPITRGWSLFYHFLLDSRTFVWYPWVVDSHMNSILAITGWGKYERGWKMNKRDDMALYCPVCSKGKIVVATSKQAANRIRLTGPQDSGQAFCFTKCRSCGAQIGVEYIPDTQVTQVPFLTTTLISWQYFVKRTNRRSRGYPVSTEHRVRSLTSSFLAMRKALFLLSFRRAERRKGQPCRRSGSPT